MLLHQAQLLSVLNLKTRIMLSLEREKTVLKLWLNFEFDISRKQSAGKFMWFKGIFFVKILFYYIVLFSRIVSVQQSNREKFERKKKTNKKIKQNVPALKWITHYFNHRYLPLHIFLYIQQTFKSRWIKQCALL